MIPFLLIIAYVFAMIGAFAIGYLMGALRHYDNKAEWMQETWERAGRN